MSSGEARSTRSTRSPQIVYTVNGLYYLVPGVRECSLWLSTGKYRLPVPCDWRRAGGACAVIMRGRDYYRMAAFVPQNPGLSKAAGLDDELVRDYRDAAWWTPGLEEAWAEAEGMAAAMEEARKQIDELSRLHVCEQQQVKIIGKIDLHKKEQRG